MKLPLSNDVDATVGSAHLRRSSTRLQDGLFAAGGLAGALLASTCCVLPLALVLLGIGGVWLGMLTALEPYKPYFVAMAAGLIGLGFWNLYGRRPTSCAPGDARSSAPTRRIVKTLLWLASGLVLLSATVDLWAPLLY